MPLSRANPSWTFNLWLTFQRHRRGEIGDLARYVDQEGYDWPGWRDREGLEAYLREQYPALLPAFDAAWEEHTRAIETGMEY